MVCSEAVRFSDCVYDSISVGPLSVGGDNEFLGEFSGPEFTGYTSDVMGVKDWGDVGYKYSG